MGFSWIYLAAMKPNTNTMLGDRIRALRKGRNWTLEELGSRAAVNDKFLGEIERGRQNPSYQILVKIAAALGLEVMELVRFGPDIVDAKRMKSKVKAIIDGLPEDDLKKLYAVLNALYPTF